VAQGKVRCSRCNHAFNAVKNLRESPQPEEEEEWPESLLITPVITSPLESELSPTASKIEFEITTQLLKERKEEEEEEYDAEPEIAVTTGQHGDSSPVEPDPLEPDEEIEPPPEEPDSNTIELGSTLPFDLPDNLQPIEPSSKTDLLLEELADVGDTTANRSLIWAIGVALMLVIIIGQLTWFKRQEMIQHPEGRVLVELLCKAVDCQLPPRRAPKAIKVLNRSISLHPEVEGALQIKLTFANRADFSQPYPILQISLFAKDERLVVRRRFKPAEYLSRPLNKGEIIQPAEAVMVTMAFEDPGKGVTGFKLEFF
jgi:hypothetical protein